MAELKSFLSELGLDDYLDAFLEGEIKDIETIGELSEDDLKELGLKLGARKKLLKALNALKNKDFDLSEQVQQAIDTFPYPIALPLKLLYTKVDVEARVKSLVDVLTHILKYQAIL